MLGVTSAMLSPRPTPEPGPGVPRPAVSVTRSRGGAVPEEPGRHTAGPPGSHVNDEASYFSS